MIARKELPIPDTTQFSSLKLIAKRLRWIKMLLFITHSRQIKF